MAGKKWYSPRGIVVTVKFVTNMVTKLHPPLPLSCGELPWICTGTCSLDKDFSVLGEQENGERADDGHVWAMAGHALTPVTLVCSVLLVTYFNAMLLFLGPTHEILS